VDECKPLVYGVELSGVAAKEFFDTSGMPRSVGAADRAPGADSGLVGAGARRAGACTRPLFSSS
jgi:hypothetical protein